MSLLVGNVFACEFIPNLLRLSMWWHIHSLLSGGIASRCYQFCPILTVVFSTRVAASTLFIMSDRPDTFLRSRRATPLNSNSIDSDREVSNIMSIIENFTWVVMRSKSGPLMNMYRFSREYVDHHLQYARPFSVFL